MKKSIALLAVCATALSPILTAPAFAAVTVLDTVSAAGANDMTLNAMELQCDGLASAHGPRWSGELDESSITPTYVSGPTEVGTHTYDTHGVGDRTGEGTFTPAHTAIVGDPYRNGGSVNMFGDAFAIGGRYSASSYDFENDFTSVYSYAFSCNLSENVDVPLQGHYVVNDDGRGNDAAQQNACNAFTALGPTWPFWGQNHAQCRFVQTGGGGTEDQPRTPEAGTPINQSQTDNLLAHESFGEGFSTSETLAIGSVVVCISPSKTGTKLPGSWTKKNGYTGDKCTTVWYEGGARTGVSNLNDGSHNFVTVPLV